MPKPGITKISNRMQATPERNMIEMSQPGAPCKNWLQKNSTKQTKATNAPMPKPGRVKFEVQRGHADKQQQNRHAFRPQGLDKLSAQPGSTSAGSFSSP